MGNFSKSLRRTLNKKALGDTVINAVVPLAEGHTFWATRVPERELWQLKAGQCIALCRRGRNEILGFEILDNKLGHPSVPCISVKQLLGSKCFIIRKAEINTMIRFEVRANASPEMAFAALLTALPPLN